MAAILPMSGALPAVPPAVQGLAALEARLRQDLAWLELPARPWVAPRLHEGQPMAEVVIIGAGMAGLCAAGALKLQGIPAVVYDRAPAGFEGPWATTARMETLRSPKHLTGPALGLPALTFRAWFEAQFGEAAWAALDKIPRLQWMDYLRWFRRVLAIEVRNDHTLLSLIPQADDRVELRLRHPDGEVLVQARRVVLATGRDGLGGASVPAFASALPRERWIHSADVFDHDRLAGLRVGVVGGSASAMDSAATALEAGAASVDLLIRRPVLPLVNKSKGAVSPGFTHGYQHLSDDWKWRIRHYMALLQTPPPRGSTLRVSRHPNARFNLGCPILQAWEQDGALRLRTPRGLLELDFLIFCTGFRMDWSVRPEFAAIGPHLRRWRDRFQPPPGDEDEELADLPDLGPAFEFQERTPGACPGLSRVHCFCYPSVLSHGPVSGDIPAISEGAQRLAQGLASRLFGEGIAAHYELLQQYSDPELLGDEWRPAGSAHFLPDPTTKASSS
ncbi:MAG: SidA/IucD/PvdA family monooxygenase [Burkholderiales bacterium]|nr:SidA/IucD/PvdA family monooxygenase [Burkholderiales bacterium]